MSTSSFYNTTGPDSSQVTAIEGSVSSASASAAAAEAAKVAAQSSASQAAASASSNSANAIAAEASKVAAQAAENNAETAETNAETAETNAAASAAASLVSKNAAATSAASSESSKVTSVNNAATATTKAAEAATSETNAAASAATATTKAADSETARAASVTAKDASVIAKDASVVAKNAAVAAQAAAETAETNAETAETNASASASAASSSAATASTKSTEASTSAANSSTSENNAASSASLASTSAATATTKASEASASETIATTKAAEASTSASNAASSQALASTSAASATTSAATSTTKASEASTSASNAAVSATSSGNSASSAVTAQTAAEAARDAALAAFDSFDDRYLGSKSSAPTVDNDGDALAAGMLYFNTTTDEMKVYDGSQWLNAYASLSGALLATSNLSDLNNAGTARSNLGLGTAATTASTDYATAAQGTKVDGIETAATADQTDAEIRAAVEAATDSNVFTDADHSKLNAIEASADVTNTNTVTAAGALMDSELTSIASVKALNQGVATADSPTFAGLTTSADVSFGDNDKAIFGLGSDLQVYHDGSNSYIDEVGQGTLYVRADSATTIANPSNTLSARFRPSTSVSLYYNGVEKLATTSTGIDVTGTATADKVTIGTSSASNGKLTLEGVDGADSAGIYFNNTTATNGKSYSLNSGNSGEFMLYDRTSSAYRLFVSSAGNVGINSASPAATLHTVANAGTTGFLLTGAASNNIASFYTSGGSQAMALDSAGNLLVGTTATTINTSSSVSGHNLFSSGYTVHSRSGQTVMSLNRLSNDGTIVDFRKDGSVVGNIGTQGGDLYLGTDDANIKFFNSASIQPVNSVGGVRDNAIDLGASSARFRDLYLSGNALVGRTSSLSSQSGSVSANTVVSAHGPLSSHQTNAGILEYYNDETLLRSYGANAGSGELVFKVGGGGGSADSEAMRISSTGAATFSSSVTADGQLTSARGSDTGTYGFRHEGAGKYMRMGVANASFAYFETDANGGFSFEGDVSVANKIIHAGDTNTYMEFSPDVLDLYSGGSLGVRIQPAGVTINEAGANNIDFRVESESYSRALHVDAGTDDIRMGGTNTQPWGQTTGLGTFQYKITEHSAQISTDSATGYANLYLNKFNITADDTRLIAFYVDGNQVATITGSTTGVTYNTSSDRRLKKDIETITDGTDKLMAMNPVTHGWKADPEADTVHGFIAQEMMDIVPEAVSGDPESDEMMSMDYGRITPVIVAALQDALTKIETLETRLTALENA